MTLETILAAIPLPEGDRLADTKKLRRIGAGGGDVLYECWGDALRAYGQAVALEAARDCAQACEKMIGAGRREIADAIRERYGVKP